MRDKFTRWGWLAVLLVATAMFFIRPNYDVMIVIARIGLAVIVMLVAVSLYGKLSKQPPSEN